MGGTKVKHGTFLLKWYWFYSYLFFLWRILLPVEDCRRKRTPIDHPTSSSHGVSCFLLEIAVVRGPQLTTSSPPSYGLSCFLFELTKGMEKIPPPTAKIQSPPFVKIPLPLSPKYHPPIAEILPPIAKIAPTITKIPPPISIPFQIPTHWTCSMLKLKRNIKKSIEFKKTTALCYAAHKSWI